MMWMRNQLTDRLSLEYFNLFLEELIAHLCICKSCCTLLFLNFIVLLVAPLFLNLLLFDIFFLYFISLEHLLQSAHLQPLMALLLDKLLDEAFQPFNCQFCLGPVLPKLLIQLAQLPVHFTASVHPRGLKLDGHLLFSPDSNVKLDDSVWLNPYLLEIVHQLLEDVLRLLEIPLELLVSESVLLGDIEAVLLVPFVVQDVNDELKPAALPAAVHPGDNVVLHLGEFPGWQHRRGALALHLALLELMQLYS